MRIVGAARAFPGLGQPSVNSGYPRLGGIPGNVLLAFGTESGIAALPQLLSQSFIPDGQQGSAIATIRSSGMT